MLHLYSFRSASIQLDMVQNVNTVFEKSTDTFDLFCFVVFFPLPCILGDEGPACKLWDGGHVVHSFAHSVVCVCVCVFQLTVQLPFDSILLLRQTSSNIRLRDEDMERYRPPACLKEPRTKCTK